MDQVYLALRIAAGRLMQNRAKELPFIFDDSFVNYDSIRLRAALLWIANNVPEQIIVFSCHMREAQLMTATMQDFNLIEYWIFFAKKISDLYLFQRKLNYIKWKAAQCFLLT